MRLWLSLALILALLTCICKAQDRYKYEDCPSGSVCIVFDDNACQSDYYYTMDFRGYVLRDWSYCVRKNYGLNHVGLEIIPNNPIRWDVTMTIMYCHMSCEYDEKAQQIGMKRLTAAQFDFGRFNLSFPNDKSVRVTWNDRKETSEFRMGYADHFRIRGNNKEYQWYNIFKFSIESDRGNLIDLISEKVKYYGFILEENENILDNPKQKWTRLKNLDLFLHQLKIFNGCDMDKYFDKNECPNNSACIKPLNKGDKNTCKIGKLQVYSKFEWADVDKLSCNKSQWKYDSGTIKDQIISKMEHARCLVLDDCSLDMPFVQKDCLNSADCNAADLTNKRHLTCQIGFDLEVELNKEWIYHKDVRCYGDYLSRMDGNSKFVEIVEAVRCRKQRKCDLSKFFEVSKCIPKDHCIKPSNITYSCDSGYQLQYTSVADPTSWKALDKLECIEDQLRITNKTSPSDLVPLNVRCMKKKKCDLKLFAQPAGDCGADNICKKATLKRDKKIYCPSRFGLQAQVKPNFWEIVTLTCTKDEELVITKTNNVPLQIRCIHKNINKFFVASDCQDDELCEEPVNCDSMTCKNPLWNLQMKSSMTSNAWRDVQNVKCNSDKFVIGDKTADLSSQFRCVFKSCAIDLTSSSHNCLQSIECTSLVKTGASLSCPIGFDLEVKHDQKWRYLSYAKCYDKSLFRVDSNGTIIDNVTDVRCRKQRKCDLHEFFVNSKCENNELCKMPSANTFTCQNDFQLQYAIEGDIRWRKLNKLECSESQLRLTIKNESKLSDIIPLYVRCMKKKQCTLENYAQPIADCGEKNECENPIWNASKVVCTKDYGLQAEFSENNWNDAAITCNSKKELIIYGSNNVPLQIRCIRKNISKFFDANDCAVGEICKEPKNCNLLECAFGDNNHLWNLQSKSSSTNVWRDVLAVKCNSDKFVIDNVPETADSSSNFRCVLNKCTSCENPCPNCVSGSSFNESNKWDECVKFSCGPNTRTIFGTTEPLNPHFECSNFDNGASFWKLNGSSEAKNLKIQCEKLCSLQSPLKSTCPPNSPSCKEHDSSDFEQLSCGRNIYAYFENGDLLHINKMSCDKHDGLWKANNMDGNKEVIIPEGTNVYCYEGECELSRIFPSCESDFNECTDYDIENHRYTCKEPFTFWERYRSDGEWKEMKDVSELQCLAGSIVANGKKKDYDFQANCRMKVTKTAAAKSQLGVYLGVMFLVLLLTVVVIATIILRISGNGWLHTLVIELIRNRNKKRARSHSSSSSLPKSNQSRTPIAKSPMTNSSSKKTQKGSPSSKSKSSSKTMRKTTGRANSSLSSVPASSDGASKMNSLANEPKKVFVI